MLQLLTTSVAVLLIGLDELGEVQAELSEAHNLRNCRICSSRNCGWYGLVCNALGNLGLDGRLTPIPLVKPLELAAAHLRKQGVEDTRCVHVPADLAPECYGSCGRREKS